MLRIPVPRKRNPEHTPSGLTLTHHQRDTGSDQHDRGDRDAGHGATGTAERGAIRLGAGNVLGSVARAVGIVDGVAIGGSVVAIGPGSFSAVADATQYVEASLPDKLLDDKAAAKVVEEADQTLVPYTTGVNWSSMFKQLQDQWAQFTEN
ncbi:hypothetical protein EP30_09795 [Bifidobacterium sp. UTCIF-39]|uniref:hypothetical protein n=1 Tax=Bifidobacterium sp. UTCIF-39 TaxID=1465359 RepID=UPI001128A3A4|nr:hypothetical protein [Bifidobacterium sp. UTCIF-39]TPF96004.1 hypothetical protein EP30_09795 [Bifidobacterium sp. UTCIF-39]